MIVNISDFTGKYELHTGIYDQSKLQDYIDKYEMRYLIELFGASMYDEFISDLNPANIPYSPNYLALFNPFHKDVNSYVDFNGTTGLIISEGIKEMLKGFIYYEYLKDTTNQITPNGMVIPSNENSTTATTLYSMMYTRYNEAIKTYRAIQYEIITNYNIVAGQVLTLTLVNPGTNYNNGTNIPTTGGIGTGLTVDIVVDLSNIIDTLTINNAGLNYSLNDLITITTGDDNATASVDKVGIGNYKLFKGKPKSTVYWI